MNACKVKSVRLACKLTGLGNRRGYGSQPLARTYLLTYLLVISLTWHTTIASTLSRRPAPLSRGGARVRRVDCLCFPPIQVRRLKEFPRNIFWPGHACFARANGQGAPSGANTNPTLGQSPRSCSTQCGRSGRIAPTVLPQQDLVHRPVIVCLLGSCSIQEAESRARRALISRLRF